MYAVEKGAPCRGPGGRCNRKVIGVTAWVRTVSSSSVSVLRIRVPAMAVAEKNYYGEVFTRRWVVETLPDLTGYTTDVDLGDMSVVEPSCGSGAFLGPLVERLIESAAARGDVAGVLRDVAEGSALASVVRATSGDDVDRPVSTDQHVAEGAGDAWTPVQACEG
jgi:hypothetical protein